MTNKKNTKIITSLLLIVTSMLCYSFEDIPKYLEQNPEFAKFVANGNPERVWSHSTENGVGFTSFKSEERLFVATSKTDKVGLSVLQQSVISRVGIGEISHIRMLDGKLFWYIIWFDEKSSMINLISISKDNGAIISDSTPSERKNFYFGLDAKNRVIFSYVDKSQLFVRTFKDSDSLKQFPIKNAINNSPCLYKETNEGGSCYVCVYAVDNNNSVNYTKYHLIEFKIENDKLSGTSLNIGTKPLPAWGAPRGEFEIQNVDTEKILILRPNRFESLEFESIKFEIK